MITSRHIEATDEPLLQEALQRDSYHADTATDFFYAPGTMCNVYEDDEGPTLFCRGTKALRLDIQFVNNSDFARNRTTMLEGFPALVTKAREAGFTEIIFFSNSPLLVRFCTRQLGFSELDGELRLIL